MHFFSQQTPKGFELFVSGEYKSEPCEFRFPEHIWQSFPQKQALINELAYVCTMAVPMILQHNHVSYNTPVPHFFDQYNEYYLKDIPIMVESISDENAYDILNRFNRIQRHFSGPAQEMPTDKKKKWDKKRAVLPFTYGKDSLLSLVLLQEEGFEVFPVLIDDRILPRAIKIKKGLHQSFQKEFNLSIDMVENELQLLTDYQVLKKPETRLYQAQASFLYVLAMLPFCHYYEASIIVMSNEYHNSLDQVFKDDLRCAHKVMQTTDADSTITDIIETTTKGKVKAINLIKGLGNFAIHSILHEQFKPYGKYRVSCHLELVDYNQWCHDCDRCIQAYMFFLAHGTDPFDQGFETSVLNLNMKEHSSLFRSKKIHPDDEYHMWTRDEALLAFLWASQRNAKGPLIDLFKKNHLTEAISRETELKNKIFSVQEVPYSDQIEIKISNRIKNRLKAFL